MRCFLLGMLGGLLLLVVVIVASSQYSDYQSRAQTEEWLYRVEPIQADIEKNAIRQNSLMNAGRNVDKKAFQYANNLNLFEIAETGMLILRGGKEGQAVILIPSLAAGQVTWRCIGGPSHAIPSSRCVNN